ncbi:MAG: ChaN family lipoprotein [Polyangiales bacterium]
MQPIEHQLPHVATPCTRAPDLRGRAVISVLLPWLVAAAIGCGAAQPLRPDSAFVLPLGREHPLSGRVFSVGEQTYIESSHLYAALQKADYVLLGETHDNRDHHRLQAALLTQFLAAHPNARVAFEMLDEADVPVLAAHDYHSSAELAARVGWAESGWPDFALYAPIFDVALGQHAELIAAHPSVDHVRASMRGVAEDEARALHLDVPLPDAQVKAQYDEIRESHCGHAPDAMLTMMQHAQAYKDAFMARAVLSGGHPTALITGRGHVRKDRAVPLFLQRAGASRSVSVGLIDVDDKRTAPSDYDIGAFDFVVFTPRVSDEDPCEQFRQQLEQMRKQHESRPHAEGGPQEALSAPAE